MLNRTRRLTADLTKTNTLEAVENMSDIVHLNIVHRMCVDSMTRMITTNITGYAIHQALKNDKTTNT